MHKSLRQVAPELVLHDVELLRQQAGGPSRRSGPLEPAETLERFPGLEGRERQPEVADQEGAFCLAEGRAWMPIAVDKAIVGQLSGHCPAGRLAARVPGCQGAPDLGE